MLAVGGVGYAADAAPDVGTVDAAFWERVEASEMRCADDELTQRMIERILEGKRQGDTCGGVFEVVATGVPIGLGSYSQWDRRLSTRVAQALMSIPSAKGVEIGGGFALAALPGSQVHDVVRYDADHGLAPSDEQRRRHRGRHQQRRANRRARRRQADSHAGASAALGGRAHRRERRR